MLFDLLIDKGDDVAVADGNHQRAPGNAHKAAEQRQRQHNADDKEHAVKAELEFP